MLKSLSRSTLSVGVLALAASSCLAGDAWSGVDVGPGHAEATAGYTAPEGFARTESRVGRVNLGRGFALGLGPNGLSLSHTIGVVGDHGGAAHNFQLSVGPNGTHVSHGGAVTHGGNRRVFAGGETHIAPRHVRGGSYAGGYGRHTRAWSRSHVRRRPW